MKGCTVFCNTRIDGGGEQSAALVAKLLGADLVSLTAGDEWKNCAAVKQIWYMNDAVYRLCGAEREDFIRVLSRAHEVFIVLNFVLGGLQKASWLRPRNWERELS